MIDINEELENVIDEFLPITSLDMGCSKRLAAKNAQRDKAKMIIAKLLNAAVDAALNVATMLPAKEGINLNYDASK